MEAKPRNDAKDPSRAPNATGDARSSSVRSRPAMLRALGLDEPPHCVVIQGVSYERLEIFKHDSWAATALYKRINEQGESPEKVVCKFNRIQSIGPIPMRWLGKRLAAREAFAYQQLHRLSGIPKGDDNVQHPNGRPMTHVVQHEFLEGHPLQENEPLADTFFPALKSLLQGVHEAGFAYVDLHKRENVLVLSDGSPGLIDFQISLHPLPRYLRLVPGMKWLHSMFRRSDDFCLSKHVSRLRPDQLSELGYPVQLELPWWIRIHRMVAVPFRQTRRKLLSLIRVRDASGRSGSERFAEHAFRTGTNH